jgi:hypothetical protein
MNLVLITSMIHTHEQSIYTSHERLKQLEKSIASVHDNIPDSYIVILEGSICTKEEIKQIECFNVLICFYDVTRLGKQYGEIELITKFFESQQFTNILSTSNVKSVSKLSGRYYLTNDFIFPKDDDVCICKIVEGGNTWSGMTIVNTRYYKFSKNDLENFIERVKQIKVTGIFIDIEHSFYKYHVLPFHKMSNEISTSIHVSGNLAPNGELIYD